jgi:hypothetical protein
MWEDTDTNAPSAPKNNTALIGQGGKQSKGKS